MDERFSIMHLRLAIFGGFVIVAVGLLSLLRFHHVPIASFAVGPLVSLTAWRALRDIQRKRSMAEIRMRPFRRRI